MPDAELLRKLVEILETEVSSLLGNVHFADSASEDNIDKIAEQLARINEQLAVKNRRWNKIWKIILFVILFVFAINVILFVFSFAVGKTVYEKSTIVEYSFSAEGITLS